MPHSPELASRLRGLAAKLELRDDEVVSERKMFGGTCITLNGKMLSGVEKDRIVIRVTDSELELGLENGTLVPMDLTGRPMRNFAFLTERSMADDESILRWIQHSAQYVRDYMLPTAKTREKKR